jgi:diketogulonate reductase-like aldo/keto reductase
MPAKKRKREGAPDCAAPHMPPLALPRLGLGTFKLKGGACQRSVLAALQPGAPGAMGFGLVDTAHIYGNERDVGRALARLPVPSPALPVAAAAASPVAVVAAATTTAAARGGVYVQTKLWRSQQGVDAATGRCRAAQALPRQLKLLGLSYVDCWLLHWPGPGRYLGRPPVRKRSGADQPLPWGKELIERNQGADAMVPADWAPAMRRATWRAMCADLEAGRARALGVCNLSAAQLAELLAWCDAEGLARPSVLQNELHPLLRQPRARALCREEGVLFQAAAPLGAGVLPLAQLPPVRAAAEAHGATSAQVLLAWALARADSVLVKFSSATHAAENAAALQLELSAEELAAIDTCGDDVRGADDGGRSTMATWLKERDPSVY